jgi:copper oxidase (laccase) domain-containing protein
MLLVGDCIAMLLVNKARTVFALVHGGLANTLVNINEKVIRLMERDYGVSPKNLEAVLSPAIQKESYIYEYFTQKDDPDWKDFTQITSDGKYQIDNVGKSISQLIALGIPESQIYNDGINTAIDEKYFSHYRDTKLGKTKDEGRFALVAMLPKL